MDYKARITAEFLAEKSHESADKMERLTDDMRRIAIKTEKETVFMRIVTVVTLFFLPGTFVSVSLRTVLENDELTATDVNEYRRASI
jgi:hypothetical protein